MSLWEQDPVRDSVGCGPPPIAHRVRLLRLRSCGSRTLSAIQSFVAHHPSRTGCDSYGCALVGAGPCPRFSRLWSTIHRAQGAAPTAALLWEQDPVRDSVGCGPPPIAHRVRLLRLRSCGSRTLSAIQSVVAHHPSRTGCGSYGCALVGAGPCPRFSRLWSTTHRARGAAPTPRQLSRTGCGSYTQTASAQGRQFRGAQMSRSGGRGVGTTRWRWPCARG
jgi:hypothetical protein